MYFNLWMLWKSGQSVDFACLRCVKIAQGQLMLMTINDASLGQINDWQLNFALKKVKYLMLKTGEKKDKHSKRSGYWQPEWTLTLQTSYKQLTGSPWSISCIVMPYTKKSVMVRVTWWHLSMVCLLINYRLGFDISDCNLPAR